MVYYGIDGQERLDRDPEDTIDNIFIDCSVDEHEYPIIVHKWVPKKVKVCADSILEDILTCLDENYGDPDSYDMTEPTVNMKAFASALASVVESEYVSFFCDKVGVFKEYTKEDVKKIISF